MDRRVLWLHRREARDRHRAGGKAANLARLKSLGFPVPNGFVIPAESAFEPIDSWSAALRKARARLREPLAVRSSMAGEDSTQRSFAGQLETVLNVRGDDELVRAIRRVQASVEHPRLRTYAQHHTLLSAVEPAAGSGPANRSGSEDALRMAVLVQEMVPARVSGIAFSADPVTGRSAVIIEAVPRLGDELARGRVEPARFVVDPRGALSSESRHALSPADFPAEVIQRLASMVREIAARFGLPQDVEWAWDGRDLYVLQSRPITPLVGKSVYSRKLVGDMTPGPIKPLVWSTNTLGMVEGVFGEIFTRLIGRNDHDFRRILRKIRSRAYVDTTFVGELLAEIGLPRNFFEAIAREERIPKRVEPNLKLLMRAPRILALGWRLSRMRQELEQTLSRHERALNDLRGREWRGASGREILARIDELLALHRRLQRCVMFGGMNLAIRMRLLKRYVARHAPEVDAGQLLLGLRGLKSLEPNRELQAMADAFRSLEDAAVELLLRGDDAAIRASLGTAPEGAELVTGIDAFLDRFGFLSANGTNFGEPTWSEEPGALWTALGRMIRYGGTTSVDPAPVRERARQEVLDRLSRMKRVLFRRRLSVAARYLELREWTSLLMTEDTFHFRRLFLALGALLVEEGRIADPEDIFLLDISEVRAVVRGRQEAEDFQGLIEERRREIEEDATVELPETILGDEIPVAGWEPEEGLLITGIGASAGVVRGRARVVRGIEDAPAHLSEDDVLVVPFSDVGWTPLFATVGGIVAECGGQLSHTAIVAREYGLPAVVGARGAMRRIQDGQLVTVDGGLGRVYLSKL